LLEEIENLRGLGVTIEDNLKISDSANVILPYHKAIDLAREEAAGRTKIGTTGRGIGPAYETKVSRYGIRVADLLDPDILRKRIEFACAEKNPVLAELYHKPTHDPKKLFDDYTRYGEVLAPRITNGTVLINEQIRAGKRVMFEGAQGTMLDIDHGTYPFVTSSSTVAGGICTGLGVAPKHIHRVIGVAKAYTTRVGGGAFPTELDDAHGEHLRRRGNEFGTVTGRPRRTGWLDLPVVRTSAMLNGLDALALTKLDVLDGVETLEICTAYKCSSRTLTEFPSDLSQLAGSTPVYESMPGWKTPTKGVRRYEDLPEAARKYIARLEEVSGVRVAIVSTGSERDDTILRKDVLKETRIDLM
ncbi:MAG TPA: adenylosuccinate synthase, partial [Vicinamibacterales bacterium]|nr:adenylosuccinate synthase [Vicinamibacterales bacterium]